MNELLMFGAQSEGEAIYGFFLVAVCIAILIVRLFATYDVNTESGVPRCPKCNRQVSHKRSQCRSCGYKYVTYGMGTPRSPVQSPAFDEAREKRETTETSRERDERREENKRINREKERLRQREGAKEAARVLREELRLEYYRSRGVEPGRWAWFKALPDLAQALVGGLLLAIPVVIVLLIVYKHSQ
jgi:hypothetical protein